LKRVTSAALLAASSCAPVQPETSPKLSALKAGVDVHLSRRRVVEPDDDGLLARVGMSH
jgi:hypothetical protein